MPPGTPAMPLFWKPYKSDLTSFIEALKADKPALEAEQRQHFGAACQFDTEPFGAVDQPA